MLFEQLRKYEDEDISDEINVNKEEYKKNLEILINKYQNDMNKQNLNKVIHKYESDHVLRDSVNVEYNNLNKSERSKIEIEDDSDDEYPNNQ